MPDLGTCSYCREPRDSADFEMCSLCRQTHREKTNTYRTDKPEGECRECTEPAVPGRKRCQRHLDADAARASRYWRERAPKPRDQRRDADKIVVKVANARS